MPGWASRVAGGAGGLRRVPRRRGSRTGSRGEPGLPRDLDALRGWPNAVGAPGGVQMRRRRAGGGGLRRVTLRGPHIGYRLYQCDQAEDQRDLGERGIAQGGCGGGQQPGRPAEAVPAPGVRADTPVRDPGGPGIGVGGPAQLPAAQRRRSSVQGVRGGPGGVGGGPGSVTGELPDLGGRAAAARVACSQIASRSAAVSWSRVVAAAGRPPVAQLGQGEVRCQLPAAVPDRPAGPRACRLGARRRSR